MVLVLDKKPMQGRWWKYGLAVAAGMLLLWVLLGFKLNPDFDVLMAAKTGYVVYGTFIAAAFFPFGMARLGLKRLYAAALIGFCIGAAAYVLMASYEPIRLLNPILPFVGFVQISSTCVLIGLLIEFGRYVYLKVVEE